MKNWQRIAKKEAEIRKNLDTRMAVYSAIRRFFVEKGYMEVETPSLSKAGEQNLNIDQFCAKNTENTEEQYYLTTSPEYSMKKLLAAGYEQIFQICKAFRAGEPPSKEHQPEFTILEWYHKGYSWKQLADETEEMVKVVAKNALKEQSDIFAHINQEWERISLKDLFHRECGIDLDQAMKDRIILEEYIQKNGYRDECKTLTWQDCFDIIFIHDIEPKLGKERPTIIYDFPHTMAALAQKNPNNPLYAQRFELYINGLELANAFQELTNPREQHTRFKEEQEKRKQAKKTILPIDEDFIEALEWGIPPCSGIAFGLDRFVMLLTVSEDIRETLAFPH